jgi:uracil-DNA glycosylase
MRVAGCGPMATSVAACVAAAAKGASMTGGLFDSDVGELALQRQRQLQDARWQQWQADPSWKPYLAAFFDSAVGAQLLVKLQADVDSGARIYPPQPLRALLLTPLPQVRVVILGQDPYHQAGQANGLAFSVAQGVNIPPSLRNMYKELHADAHAAPAVQRTSGCLDDWADQGVLLLNTCLTVRDSAAASHASWGWEALTDAIVCAVAQRAQPCVFVLWGAHAQSKQALIEGADAGRAKRLGAGHASGTHVVLRSNHPSPLSATRGPVPFIGSRVFSRINEAVVAQGQPPVVW